MIEYEKIKLYCLAKAKAYVDYPFGPFPVCFKVCNRIFLEWYPDDDKITVRCEPGLADYYRQSYPGVVIPGYHCPDRQKPFKNTVYLGKGLSEELIYDMLDHSYQQAVKSLRKRDQAELQND